MDGQGLKALTRTREPKFGHFIVEFATPGIGHILKSAGCEFALFDMEHSGFGMETLKSAIRYFEAASLPAIVRVPSKEYHHIARACDAGAEGLMLPMVGTPDEVRRIIDCMKYHPQGSRGVALQIAHDNYRPGAVADKFGRANERTTFVLPDRDRRGRRERRRHRGHRWRRPASGSVISICRFRWAFPAQFDDPKFKNAVERVVAAARRHDRSLGRLVPTVEQGIEVNRLGFDFICYSGDVWVLHDALAAALARLRAGCGKA